MPARIGVGLTQEDGDIIEDRMYRQIVGKIMYLTNKLLIEGANSAWEMSIFLMKPKKSFWKAVEFIVGYLKSKQDKIQLTYYRPKDLCVLSVADANYATDKENQRIVSGNIMMLGGTIISWSSKVKGFTTLSSTEAEYCALLSVTQKLAFVHNNL